MFHFTRTIYEQIIIHNQTNVCKVQARTLYPSVILYFVNVNADTLFQCCTLHAKLNPSNPLVPLQLVQFKEDNAGQLGSAESSLEQALERTKANINWVAMNKKEVLDWFTSESSSPV